MRTKINNYKRRQLLKLIFIEVPKLKSLSKVSNQRGRRRRRGVRNERKIAEDQKTNPPWKRRRVEQVFQNPRQQRRVLLHQLRHHRHQYHFFFFQNLILQLECFDRFWIEFLGFGNNLFFFCLDTEKAEGISVCIYSE